MVSSKSHLAPVRVSKRSFALWWLSLLLLHGIVGIFFSVSALFYWQLEDTYLNECLQFYRINIDLRWYSTIAILMGLVALPHALSILSMVSATLYYRSFAFSISRTALRRALTARLKGTVVDSSQDTSSAVHRMSKLYHALCDRDGVFGIDSQYFNVILFIREIFETSLQTNQAYRMSFYLQRVWLNRFYVSLLVLNCWLTPLIQFVYEKNEAKKRLLCLVCDCALDLVSSVVIPCTILATYIGMYDWDLQGFDIMVWYDDIWYVNAVNELQILLVVTWRDLGSRLVFSLGLLISMSDIKNLLVGLNSNQVNPLTAVVSDAAQRAAAGPSVDVLLYATAAITSDSAQPAYGHHSSPSCISISKAYLDRFAKWTHMLLFAWGAIILGLHSFAEALPVLSQCLLQVQPWGRAKPACSLVLLNCYSMGHGGAQADIDAQWQLIDETMVLRLLVRHCETFEMPPALQQFSQLESLKLYNTTVADWNDAAALTTTNHPKLKSLFFIRVNWTNGELPPGLLSPEFPVMVYNVELCVTNLRSLPSDLDTKWPQSAMLYFESSAFTIIPQVALRMNPTYLSFYGNPIHELPSELFELDSIEFLHVGGTLVTSLPTNVTFDANTNPLRYLYLPSTQISYFPVWVDGLVTAALSTAFLAIYASDTPYCSQLEQIYSGSVSHFSTPQTQALAPPSVLMNDSSLNWNLIHNIVSCTPEFAVAFFPLDFEDEQSRLVE